MHNNFIFKIQMYAMMSFCICSSDFVAFRRCVTAAFHRHWLCASDGGRGFFFNVLLCVNPAIQNTCFDKLKDYIIKTMKNPTLSPVQAFTLGAVAKAIATVSPPPHRPHCTPIEINGTSMGP